MTDLPTKQLQYSFNGIEKCNMCGCASSTHKVLGKRLNQSQGKNPRKKKGLSTTVVQCDNCGLIYSDPQPIPHSIQDHYGVPPEEYWREEYFTTSESYFSGELKVLNTLMQYQAGAKSLDIGAGIGHAMIALSKAGFDAFGFEPSQPFYEKAIHNMGISADKLKLGMIENVEYEEGEFEFITFGAVLEHLYDPSGCIIKAMKWLKPKGVMHIEVPSSEWLIHKLANFFYKITGTDYVANISPMHKPFHLYEFGLKSFQEHGRLNNYQIAHHQFYVGDTYLPQYLDFIIRPYINRTGQGMQLCVWLRKV